METTKQSISEIHFAAYRAAGILRARLREIAREHSDRIRQLERLMHQLTDENPGELTGTADVTLAPEIMDLLNDPLHGL